MKPYRWLVLDLYDKSRCDDGEADDEDDEHGGTIARIVIAQVQSAVAAGRSNVKIAAKQPPLSAARTAAGEPGTEGRDGCCHYCNVVAPQLAHQ